MKTFAGVMCLVFTLLVGAHVWRVIVEGRGTLSAWFVAITLLAAALAVWSWRMYRSAPATR